MSASQSVWRRVYPIRTWWGVYGWLVAGWALAQLLCMSNSTWFHDDSIQPAAIAAASILMAVMVGVVALLSRGQFLSWFAWKPWFGVFWLWGLTVPFALSRFVINSIGWLLSPKG